MAGSAEDHLPNIEQVLMRNTHSQKMLQELVDRHSFNANVLHNARMYKESTKSQENLRRQQPPSNCDTYSLEHSDSVL